jgi:hypothetical protein
MCVFEVFVRICLCMCVSVRLCITSRVESFKQVRKGHVFLELHVCACTFICFKRVYFLFIFSSVCILFISNVCMYIHAYFSILTHVCTRAEQGIEECCNLKGNRGRRGLGYTRNFPAAFGAGGMR